MANRYEQLEESTVHILRDGEAVEIFVAGDWVDATYFRNGEDCCITTLHNMTFTISVALGFGVRRLVE